ncbi:DHA2 family efflux MFS transporter permease subunit [Mitsuaria sp. GD03876]|uniref:DHA2 family efflux MFS transporter permease subunit n=1 Tax=Mitsuaria sp. GD03876 TaxID=2975399 RepID=UPI00244D72A7|nr:DHA2 family efflux MFS transporter permease subunit [Mitsuaria sp. GD03876]MDH0864712.1 DHA2 family efflux MFS transporter permease subunit [Mitsuaria sp. GD03876]
MSAAVLPATAASDPPPVPAPKRPPFWSNEVIPLDRLTTREKVLAFATMCVGMFIALLDIQIVSASLRDIGGGLSAGADDTTWIQTSYLIAEIIVIPLSGWLASVMSTRWLFAISALGFTLASLLCGLAWNIQSMIAFRAVQGFLGGSMIPMVFTTAFMYFSGKQRVVAASTIGAIASLAPTLGPVIGGWITDVLSWQWLFYINLLPGLLVTVVVPLMVRVDKPDLSLLKGADYLSMVLLAVFLGCLEYTLEEGPRWNWFGDATIVATAWIAGITGVAFLARSLTAARPIVDLRALKDRNFALGSLFSFITGIGIFATIYLTPLFLSRVRGDSALDIGLAVFSTGVFQVMTIPLYAFLASRFDLRWILFAGLALFAVSMWEFAPITHDWGPHELLLPQALRGMAQQLSVPPVVTLALGALPPSRLKLASGLFNLMRNLGGAIGIAACATILNDRTNLHFQRLAERLNAANESMNSLLASTTSSLSAAMPSGEATTAALRQLWALTYREALTMTFSDAFLIVMACFVVALLFVPLLHKVAPPAAPSADSH